MSDSKFIVLPAGTRFYVTLVGREGFCVFGQPVTAKVINVSPTCHAVRVSLLGYEDGTAVMAIQALLYQYVTGKPDNFPGGATIEEAWANYHTRQKEGGWRW